MRVSGWVRGLVLAGVVSGLTACGGDDDPIPVPEPASLAAAGGGAQTATVGELLGSALSVLVLDDSGQPFAGASVQWSVASGGGSVAPSTSQTGADGRATTQWTLGGTAGTQRVTATVTGLSPVEFTATAEAGAPDAVVVTPATPTLEALGATAQLTATVRDAFGNDLAGVSVDWASDDEATVSVDASGVVTAEAVGSAEVSASVPGGGPSGSTTVTVEQVPAAVVVTPVDPQVATSATVQLSAAVTDANGQAIPSPTVAWTSDDDALATVDANGLVTGVAVGTVDITATSGPASGSTAVEVVAVVDDFEPTGDVVIDGDRTFGNVAIPAGVTVTFTDDAVVTALGDITVAGDVVGDCVQMEFQGRGSAEYTGSFDNGCAAEPVEEGPDLILVNQGPLTIDGATFTWEGSLQIKNDPTLIDDDTFLTAPAAVSGLDQVLPQQCIVIGGQFIPRRPVARAGSDELTFGGNGRSARKVALTCSGDLVMSGGSRVDARDGGQGGDAGNPTPSPSGNATGRGGNGGDGGDLNVRARGDITFTDGGGGTVLNLSDGGRGGDADVPGFTPGGDATAEGGDGGDGGNMKVEARGAIFIDAGGLTINVGDGGRGGHADATGGRGEDAGAAPATNGGTADATGGEGGNSVDGRLNATGGVIGEANIVLTGGDGGAGGDASAAGGNGGNGNDQFPDGADGGAMAVEGGEGGEALTRDLAGTTIGTSGDGGDVFVAMAVGGLGKNRCHLPKPGGKGGTGGAASGMPGTAGQGDNPGTDGSINVAAGTGDGGDGGDGLPVGNGGDAGADSMTGNRNPPAGPAFEQGEDGDPCKANVEVSVISDPNGHEPFIGLTAVTQLTFTLEGGDFLMVGNGVLPDMQGTIDAAGNFSLTGMGTLAGFPNVDVVFEGTISDGVIDGTLTADADNDQFPADGGGTRNPPVYRVMGTVPPPDLN